MISKSHVHKLLPIKLLQNSLYGRLAVDGTLAPEAAVGSNHIWRRPTAVTRVRIPFRVAEYGCYRSPPLVELSTLRLAPYPGNVEFVADISTWVLFL